MEGFASPEDMLSSVGLIAPEMQVAEFGCGAGFFAVVLARLVGEKGKVFAIDILESALEATKSKAMRAGLNNLEYIRANLEELDGSRIPSGSLDVTLLANILFQSDKKEAILNEAKRVLRPNGFLVVIEWKDNAKLGPITYKISESSLKELIQSIGFFLIKEFFVDNYHYGLVFRGG